MDWKSYSPNEVATTTRLEPSEIPAPLWFPCLPGESTEDCANRYKAATEKQKLGDADKPKTPRQQLLEEAIKITTSDRNKSYGNPEDNFVNIAGLWMGYFEAKDQAILLDASDVAIMMILMKCARLATNPGHHDSAVDVAGYAACLADIQENYRKSSFMVGATSQPTKPIDGVQFPNSKT